MIDIFKYASDHNVSIEISPLSKVPLCYTIRIRRGHYQMNTGVTIELLGDPDDMLQYTLDRMVDKLERYIAECKHLTSGTAEVVYYEG